MKIKIGTQLEEEVYHGLKVVAAREKRAISEVIQEAISAYLQRQAQPHGKKSGLARLLESPPLNISDEQFRETMEADFWDQ
jgi:predicted transcriptional regulator